MNNNMRKIRTEKGLTLEYISYKTNISVGYLCHLERGSRNNPSMKIMDKIAKALEKSVAEVFFN